MSNEPAGNEITEPSHDRIGNDYREGPDPRPGGVIDVGDSLIPPYDGRTGAEPTENQVANQESVKRAQTGQKAPEEPVQPIGAAVGQKQGEMAPEGVGQSYGRRGEDQAKATKEPGRYDTGKDAANRPTGESTARDKTGVNPQD
jgi:hypothetical protein